MTALLEVRGVQKHFGGVRALEGVDLALAAGQIYCIVGPNGCGKSTLLAVISGDLAPTAGTVWFDGRDITGLAPQRIARLGVLRKFQAPSICPTLSVAENLEAALMVRVAPWRRLGTRAHLQRLAELLEVIGLRHRADLIAEELAHGEKQWLEIGMLLAGDSQVLLLDEPTAGMTIRETQQTVALIRRIATEHKRTILAIEHDMHFVAGLECEVIALLRGKVLRRGSYAEVSNDPEVREAYLGAASHVPGH
ncbi:ABC transporter ATP-binding protein [Variovorax sp. PBL-E5]|uniref:ABC transporter ATP-binding protein n=1 Tax=Variovorax sp. PBL-E5 TaxID=434014 RepID=UPI00131753F2|nr:ABC transporter ATP-binding protein [Variovorax sp. PBL-E5]VTU30388.1 Ribose import ATP-binding protein RbsA [Variovorax sp. PBL-E5]